MARKILIIDSSTIIAMRVKVLLELIGCNVELIHFSILEMFTHAENYDLVVIAHGVPVAPIKPLIDKLSHGRLLLLAPKTENTEQLTAFAGLNKIVPDATVVYPFFSNKEITSLLESLLELDSNHMMQLPTMLSLIHI